VEKFGSTFIQTAHLQRSLLKLEWGSGKGSPEWWVANVKPGRVMFEIAFPNEKVAHEAPYSRNAQIADEVPHRCT
jgi:hypothetical protein